MTRTCRWCRGIIDISMEDNYQAEWNPKRKVYFCHERHHRAYLQKKLDRERPNWPKAQKEGYINARVEQSAVRRER